MYVYVYATNRLVSLVTGATNIIIKNPNKPNQLQTAASSSIKPYLSYYIKYFNLSIYI